MANFFDVNQQVAQAYVRSEQIKGLFLAQAKLILVCLSGSMMFLGVVMLAQGGRAWTWQLALSLLPVAIVAALLAIAIEGGTIFSTAMRVAVGKQIKQELSLLDKVASKFTVAEVKKKRGDIERKLRVPTAMMFVCCLFSVAGAEIFWQKLLDGQGLFFHIIGYLLGVVCSSLLIIFEMNGDLVERVIEQCIRSSAMIQLAFQQSARSQIFEIMFDVQQEALHTPEKRKAIAAAGEVNLYNVLSETVEMGGGSTVSGQQLKRMVEDEQDVRDAADRFLASGGQTSTDPVLVAAPVSLPGRRVTKNRKAVVAALKQYGVSRVVNDLDTYASELNMDRRTLEHWIDDIKQNGM